VRRIARIDPRVRCIRRVGRRGLASAVIEGALSCSATYVAVIDGDLQHDETRLPVMLTELRSGQYDLAVASRYVEGGNDDGLATKWRHTLSGGGAGWPRRFLPVKLTDPMSGFFMMPRAMFEPRDASDRPGVQDPARPRAQRADPASGEGSAGRVP
jgi:dolichol-phosphate mannosyltransferase